MRWGLRSVLIIVSLGLTLVAPIQGGSAVAQPTRATCGEWRWPIKTLSDARRRRVNFNAHAATVKDLRLRNAPNNLSSSTPRLPGIEIQNWTIKARPRLAKLEDDHDIHLVVSVPSAPRKTMIVEFPKKRCVASSFKRSKIAAAGQKFLNNCGSVSSSSWKKLDGSLKITGVGFWDERHGQTGVAPNGIELHPVLNFKGDCHAASSGGGVGGGGGGGTKTCTPGYSPCLVWHGGKDYDCYGGGGNGPYYTKPGVVYTVTGSDPYDLDTNNNGKGCE
jgi:hypothetical protein